MISYEDAIRENQWMDIELLKTGEVIEGSFTNARVDISTIPEGSYAYDLRESLNGEICTLERRVIVNHYGTFLSETPIELPENGCLTVGEDIDYSFV